MFDWNKPFTTRHKKPARLEHVLSKPSEFGETHIVDVNGEFLLYLPTGRFHPGDAMDRDSAMDLVNIPEKKVVDRWVVVSEEGHVSFWRTEGAAAAVHAGILAIGKQARIHHIREEF